MSFTYAILDPDDFHCVHQTNDADEADAMKRTGVGVLAIITGDVSLRVLVDLLDRCREASEAKLFRRQ